LRVEEWSDRDGKSRYTLDVHATDMQFLGGSRGDEMSGGQSSENDFMQDSSSAAGGGSMSNTSPADDDIPF
jgi:single-stranded DNA-binding protein